jgi:hypothetical protein
VAPDEVDRLPDDLARAAALVPDVEAVLAFAVQDEVDLDPMRQGRPHEPVDRPVQARDPVPSGAREKDRRQVGAIEIGGGRIGRQRVHAVRREGLSKRARVPQVLEIQEGVVEDQAPQPERRAAQEDAGERPACGEHSDAHAVGVDVERRPHPPRAPPASLAGPGQELPHRTGSQ